MFAVLVGDNVIGNSFNVSLKMCAVHFFCGGAYTFQEMELIFVLVGEKVTYDGEKFDWHK